MKTQKTPYNTKFYKDLNLKKQRQYCWCRKCQIIPLYPKKDNTETKEKNTKNE